MKKNIKALSLAGLMTVMSVMPVMAAPAGNISTSSKSVEYNADAGNAYDEAWDTSVKEDTEVLVSRGSTFTVKVPKKIILLGTKGATNDADYDVTVDGDIPGNVTINVVPNTASKTKLDNSTSQTDNFADGSGTFEMLEKAGIKNNITATITLADTTWTIEDDGDANDLITEVVKSGNVSVANLSAGEWSNTINFDISATK